MKRRYDDGGEIDAMQAANASDEAMDIADSMRRGAPGTSETMRATKPMRKSAPKAAPKPEAKAKSEPIDETKMSLAERAKMSRERARAGSGPTDTRSVSDRIRSAMGMKSGGSVGSASRRADGCATKGKTKGTMITMKNGGMC
jgi:hypothetical protein